MSVQDNNLWVRAYEIFQNDPSYDPDPNHDPNYHMLFSLAKIQAPVSELCIGYKTMKRCESLWDLLEQGVYYEDITLVDLYILAFKQGVIDINHAVRRGIGRALDVYTGDHSLPWGNSRISFWVLTIKRLQEKLPLRITIAKLENYPWFDQLPIEKMSEFDEETWLLHWDEIWAPPEGRICFEFKILPVNKFV